MTTMLKPGVHVVEKDVTVHHWPGPAIFADSDLPLSFWLMGYRMTAEQRIEVEEWLTEMNAWDYVQLSGRTQTPIIVFPNEQLAILFKLKFV